MDRKTRDSLTETFNEIVDVMGQGITSDAQKHGVNEAIRRFEILVQDHAKEHGTWIDAPEVERPAHMLWAAAELFIGALINAGVWRDV
jgi:hypothetical protein